jgi:predicted Zn-dependent protease
MMTRRPEGPRGPGLRERLEILEREAEVALPGFDARFLTRAGDLCVEGRDPDGAEAYYGRAIDAYLRAGRPAAAGVVCRKLLRISPGAVRARCTLAWLAIGRQAGDARWEIDEYVETAVDAGQADLARVQVRLMAGTATDPAVRATLARHLGRLGDPETADRIMDGGAGSGDPPGDDAALWSRVLESALLGPDDLRERDGAPG